MSQGQTRVRIRVARGSDDDFVLIVNDDALLIIYDEVVDGRAGIVNHNREELFAEDAAYADLMDAIAPHIHPDHRREWFVV